MGSSAGIHCKFHWRRNHYILYSEKIQTPDSRLQTPRPQTPPDQTPPDPRLHQTPDPTRPQTPPDPQTPDPRPPDPRPQTPRPQTPAPRSQTPATEQKCPSRPPSFCQTEKKAKSKAGRKGKGTEEKEREKEGKGKQKGHKNGVTLRQLIPTQRREKTHNCNQNMCGFQGTTQLIPQESLCCKVTCNNYQIQMLGDHPNFMKKTFLGVKKRFSELLEGSQNSETDSRNAKFHSQNGISRLKQYENMILGGTPGAILGIDGHPHERFSFAPVFSERYFRNWAAPARKTKRIPQRKDRMFRTHRIGANPEK